MRRILPFAASLAFLVFLAPSDSGCVESKTSEVRLVSRFGRVADTYALAFSSNASRLFSGGYHYGKKRRSLVSCWDLNEPSPKNVTIISNLKYPITYLDCDPSDHQLIAGDDGGQINLLSINDRRVLKQVAPLELQYNSLLALQFLEGGHFASIIGDGLLTKWGPSGDVKNYKLRTRHVTGGICAAAINRTGDRGVWCDYGSSLFVWQRMFLDMDFDGFTEISGPRKALSGGTHRIEVTTAGRLAISDDGARVMCTSDDGKLILYDVKKRKALKEWSGHSVDIASLIALYRNAGFVTGDQAGTIKIWSQEGAEIARFENSKQCISALAVDRQNGRLAAAGETQRIAVWDISEVGKKRQDR